MAPQESGLLMVVILIAAVIITYVLQRGTKNLADMCDNCEDRKKEEDLDPLEEYYKNELSELPVVEPTVVATKKKRNYKRKPKQ